MSASGPEPARRGAVSGFVSPTTMINDGNDFKRRAPPRSALEVPSWNLDTLLQTAPPTRIYLKSSHHGVLAFANLDEDITVGELKTLVYERLMLSPNQTVVLITGTGREALAG